MGRSTDRFSRELALPGLTRGGRSVVVPDPGPDPAGVGCRFTGAIAKDGTAADALAVLRHGVIPGAATHVVEEALLYRGLPGRVVVVPLRAPVHQVDTIGAGLDPDPADPTVIAQVAATMATVAGGLGCRRVHNAGAIPAG